jgi:hypothetical protein
MSTIQAVARFKIHPGKLQEFKRFAAQCMQLFFNADQRECVVHEEYVDSVACIQHFRNMGEVSIAIFATSDVSGEMWGNPSPELRKAVQGKDVQLFAPFLSLNE